MIGKRVILLGTSYGDGGNDSKRRRGDIGTVVDISILHPRLGGNRQFWVRWERKELGTSALIEDEDEFEILEEENYSITTATAR
jgi:hypothetical protein